jgi:hypothetical protein
VGEGSCRVDSSYVCAVFDYVRKGTSDCNSIENELREVFGCGKEYDWSLVIEEEEERDADLELAEQRQLSSTEATEEEIIVDRGIIEEEEDEIEVNP